MSVLKACLSFSALARTAAGRALAIESGRTIILDREEMIAMANESNIAILAV